VTQRSRLLPRVEVGPHDEQILGLLAMLPTGVPSSSRSREKVGITNARGKVYRVVEVSSAFELLQLTARLNALSYGVDDAARRRSPTYARIFSRFAGQPSRLSWRAGTAIGATHRSKN
jgi:hypothetical protein